MDYKNKVVSLALTVALGSGMACTKTAQVQIDNGNQTEASEKKNSQSAAEKTAPTEEENEGVYGISPEARDLILNCAVKVEVEYTLEQHLGDITVPRFAHGYGSGVAVLDQQTDKMYILTAHHVLPTEKELFGMKVLKTRITIENHPAEIYKINETFDLGLLRLNGHFLEHDYTGTLAKKINVGDLIAGAGYPSGAFKAFHTGHIAGQDLDEDLKNFIEKYEDIKKEYTLVNDLYDIFGIPQYTVVDTHITPGNSGGGVYVFENGEPKLAGLMHVGYLRKEGLKGISHPLVLKGFVDDTPIGDELLGKKREKHDK